MERKKAGRLLAAFVVALVATLGLVLGLGSTARADDAKYTIVITNGLSTVYSNENASLNTEYTATLFGPEDPEIWMILPPPGCFEYVKKAGDRSISFKASSEGSGNFTILHQAESAFGRATTFAVSVTKNTPVKYLDANGKEQTCTEYTTVTSTTDSYSGWCVVSGKVTFSSKVTFNGDAHLILCDGAELEVSTEDGEAIGVDRSLTIYAQSKGDSAGRLNATCNKGDGINVSGDPGTITINGGNVRGAGGVIRFGIIAESVIVNGGSVYATGGSVAIYAMNSASINGGTVTMAGGTRCIAYGTALSIADGIAVIEGDKAASAQPVADPSTWEPSKKWARTTVPVTSVELNPATATLEVGKTATLTATVKPGDAADKSVTWKSSDEKVATVKDGVVTAVAPGKATITVTSVDNPKATATCVVTVKGKQMFRLYNPNSGEHFYTSNAAERDNVKNAGWTYEGVGWTAPESGSPVYRLYNEFGGEHHYTTSKGEHDSLVAVGWKDEGVGWYSGGSKPLYRQYNPNAFANNHNYTTSTNERGTLLGLGWRDEGIAWYGL